MARAVLLAVVAILVVDGAALLNRGPASTSPIPRAPSGYHLTMSDLFTGHGLNGAHWWGEYAGQPGGDPNGWWEPSHVSAGGGRLLIKAYKAPTPHGVRWVTGGIGERPGLAQTYGRYLIRMRSTGGKGISVIALLFPVKSWPPEIDFYEDSPTTNARDVMTATMHYDRDNAQIQRTLTGHNFTQWQTIGVDWSPGHLSYTINGKVWATLTGSHVPSVPMTLDIQSQALTCSGQYRSCPGPTTPSLVTTEVAWVAVYQRNR